MHVILGFLNRIRILNSKYGFKVILVCGRVKGASSLTRACPLSIVGTRQAKAWPRTTSVAYTRASIGECAASATLRRIAVTITNTNTLRARAAPAPRSPHGPPSTCSTYMMSTRSARVVTSREARTGGYGRSASRHIVLIGNGFLFYENR